MGLVQQNVEGSCMFPKMKITSCCLSVQTECNGICMTFDMVRQVIRV